jgi:DNA modification methylase
MTKHKTSVRQPTFFHREVPQMPEGYYSSGPNPNLQKFVAEHAKLLDPETDDYNVPPFDQPITTTKATAIYNMHTYWSKKPHDAIQQYIRHYTQPGDLVLDPFCGSGGTALATLMEGRAAIAIDLSPAATFITKNYCTPVDVDELQRAFEELKAKVKPEMDWLYETRCDRCDGKATTAFTVYSYVFQCPRCLEKVALFDCPEVQSQTAAGKAKTIRICPNCQRHGHREEIKTSGMRFDPIPVLVSYICEEGCKPQRGERRHNDPDQKKREYFLKYDLAKIAEVEARPIPHWYPLHRMMNVESETDPWGDEWRPGRNFRTVADLFTKRNLWALSCIFAGIEAIKPPYCDGLKFASSSFLLNLSKLYKHRDSGGGQPTGNYYMPQISKENAAWSAFERKYADIRAGMQELPEVLNGNTNVIVSTQSALSLSEIPNETIDHIFTDPPYAGKYQYGELNFIWEAWLGLDTKWQSGEVTVNETRHVTDDDWAAMMVNAMQECFRVLKPGRWLALCYHDTSEGTWSMIQDIMAQVGFIADHAEEAIYIDTGQKTFNQTQAEKVTQRDLVINFRKPRPDEITQKVILTGDEDTATFVEKARAIMVEVLEAHPGSSADRLYDELVSRMVRRGEFERHNFDELLRSVAEPVSQAVMKNLFEPAEPDLFGSHETVRWYLLETAGQVDEAESRKENAAAARLEKFMHSWRTGHPGESGVHYSELFEQYLPINDKPRRLLIEWLPEFFFKTMEGTWRLPADEGEHTQLAALRSSGLLRRVKRFGNALLEGVPPHERDLPESPATLADWIRQCRRAGLYDIGRVLYEKSGTRFDGLDEVRQIELDEDYQVCVRRSEVKPIVKKKIQPSLLDEE